MSQRATSTDRHDAQSIAPPVCESRLCMHNCSSTARRACGSWPVHLTQRRAAVRDTRLAQCLQRAKLRWHARLRRQPAPAPAVAALPVAAQGGAAFAALAASAVLASLLERHTTLGRRASAPLLALALAAGAAGALPPAGLSAATAWVWDALLPLALALALLTTDLRMLGESRDALLAFGCACAATVVGTVASFCVTGRWLGTHGWRLAACLCASYTGGTLNFGATAAVVGLGAESGGRALIAAAMALDNIAMAFFLALLLSWPVREQHNGGGGDAVDAVELHSASSTSATPGSACAAFVTAAVCCAAAHLVAAQAGYPAAGLAFITVFASGAAAAASSYTRVSPTKLFAGAETASGGLLLLFFATLGACTSVSDAASLGPAAGAFIALLLFVHLVTTLAAGSALRLPLRLLLLASNAAVGGPATAAAMASARGWRDLTPTAVLLGTLGYAVGTALGVGVAPLLRRLSNLGGFCV